MYTTPQEGARVDEVPIHLKKKEFKNCELLDELRSPGRVDRPGGDGFPAQVRSGHYSVKEHVLTRFRFTSRRRIQELRTLRRVAISWTS
jgi:hypothetical protein